MVSPLNYSPYQQGADINFSSLAQLPQVYQQAQDQANVRETLATLGQGGQVDPMALIRSGNQSLAQLGFNLQQRQQEQQRQAAQDAYQREKDAKKDVESAAYLKIAQGNAARLADKVPTGFEANPDGGLRPIAGGPQDPDYLRRVQGAEGKDLASVIAQRKDAAAAVGLTPDHPAYNAFVLTNKMPREDAQPLTAGDKEAIRVADDAVLANRSAIDSLNRAKALSKQAFTGPTAGIRGYGASFLGEGSDIGKAGVATENLTNEVMTNALGQLKSIFGGNPTEGERKILLEMQGSVNKPDAVRQQIFDRAIGLAQNRLAFNQRRADELRGNTYYKPQGGQTQSQQPSSPPKAGTKDGGYIFKGGDPADPNNWAKLP